MRQTTVFLRKGKNKRRDLRCYQSNGIRSFSGKWVEVLEHERGKILVLFHGKKVCFFETQDNRYLTKRSEDILLRREYLPEM